MPRPRTLDSRQGLLDALKAARWNVSEAARALGVTRQAVYDAMGHFDIQRRPQPPELVSERNRQNRLRRPA